MSKSVICNTTEIMRAYNKIQLYAGNLAELINTYIQILSLVQKDAICDELISARLSALAEDVKPLITNMENIVGKELSQTSNRVISEINAADTFAFPHELLAHISSLLAFFL